MQLPLKLPLLLLLKPQPLLLLSPCQRQAAAVGQGSQQVVQVVKVQLVVVQMVVAAALEWQVCRTPLNQQQARCSSHSR